MECQFCSAPATVHLTDIIHKKKRVTHLCEACAREKNLLSGPTEELHIPGLLHLVLGQSSVPAKPATPLDLTCPECGIPYAHFRAQGRLGCPHDYEVFRSLLEPLMERLQNNANRHEGKVPRRHALRRRAARRAELETRLRTAVAAERYEDAAAVRDQLRALEGADHES